MRISLDTVTSLMHQGYHTLQVPMFSINFGGNQNPLPQPPDYPDEYFEFLKADWNGHRLVFGKEQGFLYLSEVGWNFFRNDIQRVFTSNRGSWQDFLNHVDEHFRIVKEKTLKHRDFILRKYQEIENEVTRRGW